MDFYYNGKRCTKEDCSSCEKCIFDEDYQENNKDMKFINKEDMGNIRSCDECPYSVKKDITHRVPTNKYYNWYCKYNNIEVVIDLSHSGSLPVNIPKWCPCKSFVNKDAVVNTNSSESKRKSDLVSMYDLMSKMPRMTEIDEIEPNCIYHIPPLMGEDRVDIIVVSKFENYLTYKIVDLENPNNNSNKINSLFFSTIRSRFLVKHKIKNIVIKHGK